MKSPFCISYRIVVPILALILITSSRAYSNESLRQKLEMLELGVGIHVGSETILNAQFIATYYQTNQFSLIWHDEEGQLSSLADELVNTVAHLADEGLNPEDYHYGLMENLNALSLIEREILLSDAYLTLASHLMAGKVDALQIKSEWKSVPKSRNLESFLPRLAGAESLIPILDSIRPADSRYQKMMAALAFFRTLTGSDWKPLASTPAIKTAGTVDARLQEIARRLMLFQDLAPDWSGSNYDEEFIQAVKIFQHRHGLKEDGQVGRETFNALNISPEQRVQQLLVNLERMRWLDAKLGDKYVLVNIAGFSLKVIENNRLVLEMPVVVGREFRKTPVFSDRIRYLVLNPRWVVPFKLAVEDKLPEIRTDLTYLSRFGFKVYQGDSSTPIDPNAIDWTQLTKRNFNLRLIQDPGPLNALGQIKFMFPNEFDVYLHDTPARDLFKLPQRDFSSGCIRVSEPIDLAVDLLSGTEWNREKIMQQLASTETSTVHLKQAIPVHIEYWTAWSDHEGVLNFRKDIYKRDSVLYAAMQQPVNRAPATTSEPQSIQANEASPQDLGSMAFDGESR